MTIERKITIEIEPTPAPELIRISGVWVGKDGEKRMIASVLMSSVSMDQVTWIVGQVIRKSQVDEEGER
jgi:hypothetical protein